MKHTCKIILFQYTDFISIIRHYEPKIISDNQSINQSINHFI